MVLWDWSPFDDELSAAWTSHEPDPWLTQRVNRFTSTVMPAIAYSRWVLINKTISTCSCNILSIVIAIYITQLSANSQQMGTLV